MWRGGPKNKLPQHVGALDGLVQVGFETCGCPPPAGYRWLPQCTPHWDLGRLPEGLWIEILTSIIVQESGLGGVCECSISVYGRRSVSDVGI